MPFIGFFALIAFILKMIVEIAIPTIIVCAVLIGIYTLTSYLWKKFTNRSVKKAEKEYKAKRKIQIVMLINKSEDSLITTNLTSFSLK